MSAADAIIAMSAGQLAEAVASGKVKAVEATGAYLAAIDALDSQVGAYTQVFTERALAQAEAVDAKRAAGRPVGALAGVPMAVKDNMCTDWGRTTCASKMLENFRAPYTATAVEKLLAADAVILGKTNLDEFAMGSSTENSALKKTANPWDLSRVPGGSSGGSAAAVAARLCAAALGSDTGGSIRQPASFCGCVGFKPSYGRVSRWGLVAFASSLDQIGPFARNVSDAALVASVIAGHDTRDSTSVDREVEDYEAAVAAGADGDDTLRVGLVKEFMADGLDDEIRAGVEKAVAAFKDAGAEIVEVSLPHSRIHAEDDGSLSSYAVACYYIVATAEASSNLGRYDGVHYGHRTAAEVDDIVELYCRSRAEGFGDEVKRRIMLGTYTLSSGYYDAYYLKALKVRRLIAGDFHAAFKQCDVLLGPTSPETAFVAGAKTADPLTMYLSDIYTISTNLAGVPALSLPAGLASDGMPVGVQLQGGVFREARLLAAARMLEDRLGSADALVPALAGGKGA